MSFFYGANHELLFLSPAYPGKRHNPSFNPRPHLTRGLSLRFFCRSCLSFCQSLWDIAVTQSTEVSHQFHLGPQPSLVISEHTYTTDSNAVATRSIHRRSTILTLTIFINIYTPNAKEREILLNNSFLRLHTTPATPQTRHSLIIRNICVRIRSITLRPVALYIWFRFSSFRLEILCDRIIFPPEICLSVHDRIRGFSPVSAFSATMGSTIRDRMIRSLLERSVADEASSVKSTFSSWDNCMAKTYCKCVSSTIS